MNASVLDATNNYLRLRIAQDLDLLISDQKLCGWMLSQPTRYLVGPWEEPFASDPAGDLVELLREYLQVVTVSNTARLMNRDADILITLGKLHAKLGPAETMRTQRTVLRECVNDVIEHFYGRDAGLEA